MHTLRSYNSYTSHHPSWCGRMGGSIHTSNTLHHLKELGLKSQRAHKTALQLHAHHSVHYAHKLTTTSLQASVLAVWVWSRRLPATLQIPTSFLFPLVGELTAFRANVSPFS
jgi:hypothetical protein